MKKGTINVTITVGEEDAHQTVRSMLGLLGFEDLDDRAKNISLNGKIVPDELMHTPVTDGDVISATVDFLQYGVF